MMSDETRYARQKRTEEQKARHASIRDQLSAGPIEAFAQALEEFQPPCRKAGIPSPWADYDSNPERREDYESDAPREDAARKLCDGCPITSVEFGGNGVCLAYRMATGQSHGVWGGRAYEDGKWMHSKQALKEAHTARRIDND